MAVAWYELSTPYLLRLLSFVIWGNLYFYTIKSFPNKSTEWCNRVVTLLHGSVASLIGWYQCPIIKCSDCELSQHITGKVLPAQYALMLWSWGYFAFDLVWCGIYWTEAVLMLCHHLAALAAITIYLHQEYTGCTFACNLLLMELSNPLLQIRWLLKIEGYKNFVFLLIEVLYVITFLFLRGIIGTYVLYWTLKTNYLCLQLKIMSVCLYLVSIALMYDLIGYIRYKYQRELDIGYQHISLLGESSCLTFNERKSIPPSLPKYRVCFRSNTQ